jgi:CO/xanthine dehydrogenase Mo-binding subunit
MVYTNTVPGGHMRSPGDAQPVHAIECHTDLCARAMGNDPLALRLRNAPTSRRNRFKGGSAGGAPPKAREVLETAAQAIGWGQPKPANVGRGIALVAIGNSLGIYSAELVVERTGQVVLHTPMMENGAGMLTVFRQLTAEGFGVALEQVRVEQTLAGFEFDRGIGGSRITRLVGKIISLLAARLRERLASLLAEELGCPADQVTFEPGGFRTPDGRFHALDKVAALAPTPDGLVELLQYGGDSDDKVEAFAAQAVEVEVDRETGQIEIKRVITAHEVGRVLNRLTHQGQIEGALIQGLGYALTEGLVLDEGRVVNTNLHEYKLPNIDDIPPLETILLEPDLRLGITPIGEGTNCGMAAGLVNAVVDVVGQQLDIPLSPDTIRTLAAQRGAEKHRPSVA